MHFKNVFLPIHPWMYILNWNPILLNGLYNISSINVQHQHPIETHITKKWRVLLLVTHHLTSYTWIIQHQVLLQTILTTSYNHHKSNPKVLYTTINFNFVGFQKSELSNLILLNFNMSYSSVTFHKAFRQPHKQHLHTNPPYNLIENCWLLLHSVAQ
jgi:hypothetical protein